MVLNQNIKGVIFDFDGTLFDLEVDWQNLNQHLQQEFGINSFTQFYEVPAEKRQQVFDIIGEAEINGVKQGKPTPNAGRVLRILANSYQLAVVSRNNQATIKAGLTKIGLKKSIPIVAREDVSQAKPHPEGLQMMLNILGLSKDSVIVVGDTIHDVDAAKRLGVCCVIIKNDKLKFTPTGADYYIDDLEKLLHAVS